MSAFLTVSNPVSVTVDAQGLIASAVPGSTRRHAALGDLHPTVMSASLTVSNTVSVTVDAQGLLVCPSRIYDLCWSDLLQRPTPARLRRGLLLYEVPNQVQL